MNSTVAKYEKEIGERENTYKKEISELNKKYEKQMKENKDKYKKELYVVNKKYQELKKVHEKEVKNLFKNVGTLKFAKEMRFFKKQWEE